MQPDRKENLFKSKVLICKLRLTQANWFEDRSSPSNPSHSYFAERKEHAPANFTLTSKEFNKTNSNWLNFQAVPPSQTFKTVYK